MNSRTPSAASSSPKPSARKKDSNSAPALGKATVGDPVESVETPPREHVEIRSLGNLVIPISAPDGLDRMVYRWTYIVRNRQRFSEDSYREYGEQSQATLYRLGVNAASLRQIADNGIVEVSIPYVNEEADWQMRIMPWESLFSLATKVWRKERHLTVVRHLDVPPLSHPPADGPAMRAIHPPALFVASAPGRLAKMFDFNTEYRIVGGAAAKLGFPIIRLDDPTPAGLSAQIAAIRPGVIHLSGIDIHQAAQLLDENEAAIGRDQDAIIFNGDEVDQLSHVPAVSLSNLLTANGQVAPELVVLNCYYSGARLAPLTVAAGARLVIGFQDTFDDTAAEGWLDEFYHAWEMNSPAATLHSFARARNFISNLPEHRQGGDIVLWTRESLLAALNAVGEKSFYAFVEKPIVPVAAAVVEAGVPPSVALSKPLYTIKPRERLNYSLLHNNANLFTKFTIQKDVTEPLSTVEVHLELYVAETAFPFRATWELKKNNVDFSDLIRVPLVASVMRERRESIRTSLYIEVKCGDHVHRVTEQVTLLPADEWTDSIDEWRWLPSFVLPRDPAIAVILAHAERYLRAISDDSSAGFNGYQALLTEGAGQEVIDLQVRALWSALLYDTPLTYINPPPTYTTNSQRLRTPSMVMEERRGTCIDLAMLFAACLEYIGIFPVVFLIQGHSFPGYWRSSEGQEKIVSYPSPRNDLGSNMKDASGGTPRSAQKWVLSDSDVIPEIAGAVSSGLLVPIETVELTRRASFAHALELGAKNLVTPWSFDAMIDIQTARNDGVTPLPLSVINR